MCVCVFFMGRSVKTSSPLTLINKTANVHGTWGSYMANEANLVNWIVRKGRPLAFDLRNLNSTFSRGSVVFSVL